MSELARRVGFLFQNPDRQICCETVRDELMFSFKAQDNDTPEAHERVDEIIELFDFDPAAEPFLLNRGTRQLLALASIIVTAPPVVILDEPTTGLDFRECEKVMGVVRSLHEQGTTVIMVCHDMEVVADFAQRIIVMADGGVVADGPTFDILRQPSVLRRASLMPPQIVDIALRLAADAEASTDAAGALPAAADAASGAAGAAPGALADAGAGAAAAAPLGALADDAAFARICAANTLDQMVEAIEAAVALKSNGGQKGSEQQ